MGPVERAVRAGLREGEELTTPGREKSFWVHRMDGRGLVLFLGKGKDAGRPGSRGMLSKVSQSCCVVVAGRDAVVEIERVQTQRP